MPYRDDRDADFARITALEHELGMARKRIAELERPPARRDLTPGARRRTSAPTPERERELGATTWTYTFPCEIPSERCEVVMYTIEALSGPGHGRVAIEGPRLMTWRAPGLEIELTIGGGRTQVSCSDTLGLRLAVSVPFLAAAVVGALAFLGGPAAAIFGIVLLAMIAAAWVARPSTEREPQLFEQVAKLLARECPE